MGRLQLVEFSLRWKSDGKSLEIGARHHNHHIGRAPYDCIHNMGEYCHVSHDSGETICQQGN